MMLFNGGIHRPWQTRATPYNEHRRHRELSPTLYFNVPKGFNDLLPYLKADPSLRDHFSR